MRGRHPIAADRRRSVMRSVRLHPSVNARLEERANDNGASLSEEAARRIERSFDTEDMERILRRVVNEEIRRVFKAAR